MRILHLIPHLSGGGAEHQLRYLAPEMAKVGHEVHIAYVQEGPESVSLPGVVLHRLDLSGNHDPMLFFKLLQIIRTLKPDIIQSWILMMDVALGLLSFIVKGTWVLRQPISEAHYQRFSLKQKLRARLAHRASAIVSNSSGGKSYWVSQGIPEQRLSVVPNGIPFEFINGIKPVQNRSATRKIVIYAGRLIRRKNVDAVINAIVEVQRTQNVLLYVAGDGPLKHYLMRLVENLKLTETVQFLGYLQPVDLWALMKAADAFISLSSFEGMPNSVCEAVACGIPVILSDVPDHRALLDDDSAFLVPVDSVTAIARGIFQALNNKQDASRRTMKALATISCWTIEAIAAKYIDLYEELLAANEGQR